MAPKATPEATPENLAKCKELLLSPKYHTLRMQIIRQNVAAKRRSRLIFRDPKSHVLNCLFNYAEEHYSDYLKFMQDVEESYKEVVKATEKLMADNPSACILQKRRDQVAASVKRVRERMRLVRALVFLENGGKEKPTKEELTAKLKELQKQWAEEAERELLTSTEGNLTTTRREVYDRITERLRAEVKERKRELDARRAMECNDS